MNTCTHCKKQFDSYIENKEILAILYNIAGDKQSDNMCVECNYKLLDEVTKLCDTFCKGET